MSEKSVQSNEKQQSGEVSNPVRQSKVDIEYFIQKKGKGTNLKKGILFGCKMCFPPRVFTNFKSLYEHFRNYDGVFPADVKSVSEHFRNHDDSFVISKCRKCQTESVHSDFKDLNENNFKEHSCQESVNLNNENQNSQENFVRKKRSSEASVKSDETIAKKAKIVTADSENNIEVIEIE